jgi:hypothetical protein
MPKKKVDKLTAEQAAEKAKPNWRAVAPVVTDAARRAEADEAAPELEQLRRKYPGEKAVGGVKAARAQKGKPAELKMVIMEPKTPSDTRAGRKAVLVDKAGKIVGEQG